MRYSTLKKIAAKKTIARLGRFRPVDSVAAPTAGAEPIRVNWGGACKSLKFRTGRCAIHKWPAELRQAFLGRSFRPHEFSTYKLYRRRY